MHTVGEFLNTRGWKRWVSEREINNTRGHPWKGEVGLMVLAS